jgi:hypothetical protein
LDEVEVLKYQCGCGLEFIEYSCVFNPAREEFDNLRSLKPGGWRYEEAWSFCRSPVS